MIVGAYDFPMPVKVRSGKGPKGRKAKRAKQLEAQRRARALEKERNARYQRERMGHRSRGDEDG